MKRTLAAATAKETKKNTGKLTVTINNVKTFQVIGPGHYRPVRFGSFSTTIGTLIREEADEHREVTA